MKKYRIKKSAIFLFVILGLSCLSFCAYKIYIKEVNGVPELLKISLNGDDNITIKYGEEYKDEGAISSYEDKNLTKKIKVTNNLDVKHIGTYKYVYKIKYKKLEKEVVRKIQVIDDISPEIKILGHDKIILAEGREFTDPGAKASDNYDGDITDKIVIDKSSLDINKIGTYKVIYTIKDSSGNEAKTEREVEIRKKGDANQRIAVLNYHFFFEENEKDICRESICEHMDDFREQLNYLRDNNYYTATMEEFVKWMYKEIDLPEKTVLITVDDGSWGTGKINGNHLIPTLESYKMNATLFLITGWYDMANYESEYLTIQSHTHDLHYEAKCGYRSKVNCVSYDALMTDLKKSIDIIKNTDSFCFPFYEYTSTSIKAVKDAGFKTAFINGWRKASRNDDKYKIPRFPIQRTTTISQFKNML